MANWKTVLTSGGTDLGQVDIRRGIFQGDSLSPLLFVLIMLPLTLVLQKIRAGYRLVKNINGGSRQNVDRVPSLKNLIKNEIFVHFYSNLGILTEFQKLCDPVWIRY